MPSSNIQVFVKWKDQTIFAGEDVECVITFKNVTDTTPAASNGGEGHQRKLSRVANHASNSASDSFFSFKSGNSLFSGRRSYSIGSQRKPFHRTASSLSSPLVGSSSFPPNSPSTPRSWQPGHSHKRSVSILSIDSEGHVDSSPSPQNFARAKSIARGHGRSASLQVAPRRNDSYDEAYRKVGRAPIRGFPPTDTPLESALGNLRVDTNHSARVNRQSPMANSPIVPGEPMRMPARRPQPPAIDFKFPAAPPPSEPTNVRSAARTPSPKSGEANGRKAKDPSVAPSHQQLTRILSATSVNGSSRSSGEFYSVSDHSSETLASEYTNYSVQGSRPPPPARHARHYSSVVPSIDKADNDNQALLMGYAQVSASFTVDGSLVDQSVFDEVKRKGVVGGQGSGLTGRANPSSDRSRKGGGFWGAFKWNTIEESINGLMSNNELDGLREMRGVASSRAIPLLSTTQSLLFVDLRLAPGEEQSYTFSFTLPEGLPASHKGKAIKISYNLVIGTQRPSGPNEPQKVNRINIPFRVFSGVNVKGDVVGHDLMSPYVLLRDEAKVTKVGPNTPAATIKNQSISSPWGSAGDFLTYVDNILEQRARSNTLFPPGALHERQKSMDTTPSQQILSAKDTIDLAILRSNQAIHTRRSPNRFEIAREGQRIAVVVLNRPAHRLGETIIATLDFGEAAVPCYAVRASLETSEKVTPTLAVRSSASIHRATRRIYASLFENTLYSTRVVFAPAIPIAATPTIRTSGVSLDWELRFEFVTASSTSEQGPGPSGIGLLETLSADDRGKVMSAMERLGCESFEISIPLTVYGETVREQTPEENEGYSI